MRAIRAARLAAYGVGGAVAAYAACAATAWLRYGHPTRRGAGSEPVLDHFMPTCDVRERHHVRVAAPADVTLGAAKEMVLSDSPGIRAIFKARELILGGAPSPRVDPRGLIAEVEAMGWGVLAERPGREIVMGAVTQPWKSDVVFRSLRPDEFPAFREPGYVKIVWNLRSEPVGDTQSIFSTETRAVATDRTARRRFRWYWSFASPGIVLIRLLTLRPLKVEAERRARRSVRVA